MLKYLSNLFLFLAATLCFSNESGRDFKEWQIKSMEYFASRSANLLTQEPWHALENFQKASTLVDQSDNSSNIINFLILFGQTVAYDTLGFREQCIQSLGSLFLVINECDLEETENEDEEESPSLTDESIDDLEILRTLAQLAPSADVKELLLSLVDEITEDAAPAFSLSKASINKHDWEFDYDTDMSVVQCKSFWKKCKKWATELVTFLRIIHQAYKSANDILEENQRRKEICR